MREVERTLAGTRLLTLTECGWWSSLPSQRRRWYRVDTRLTLRRLRATEGPVLQAAPALGCAALCRSLLAYAKTDQSVIYSLSVALIVPSRTGRHSAFWQRAMLVDIVGERTAVGYG